MNESTYGDTGLYIPTDIFFNAMEEVDVAVRDARLAGSIWPLIQLAAAKETSRTLTGLQLARIYYEAEQLYEDDEEESFDQFAAAQTGKSNQTVRKYREAWQYLMAGGLPEKVSSHLRNLPIGTLLLLTPAIKGGDIQEAGKIPSLLGVVDEQTAKELVREVRGTQTSATNSLALSIDHQGYITAHHKGERYAIGILFLEEARREEIIDRSINRIINNSGILEKA